MIFLTYHNLAKCKNTLSPLNLSPALRVFRHILRLVHWPLQSYPDRISLFLMRNAFSYVSHSSEMQKYTVIAEFISNLTVFSATSQINVLCLFPFVYIANVINRTALFWLCYLACWNGKKKNNKLHKYTEVKYFIGNEHVFFDKMGAFSWLSNTELLARTSVWSLRNTLLGKGQRAVS
jgi:hypothetical protein